MCPISYFHFKLFISIISQLTYTYNINVKYFFYILNSFALHYFFQLLFSLKKIQKSMIISCWVLGFFLQRCIGYLVKCFTQNFFVFSFYIFQLYKVLHYTSHQNIWRTRFATILMPQMEKKYMGENERYDFCSSIRMNECVIGSHGRTLHCVGSIISAFCLKQANQPRTQRNTIWYSILKMDVFWDNSGLVYGFAWYFGCVKMMRVVLIIYSTKQRATKLQQQSK